MLRSKCYILRILGAYAVIWTTLEHKHNLDTGEMNEQYPVTEPRKTIAAGYKYTAMHRMTSN